MTPDWPRPRGSYSSEIDFDRITCIKYLPYVAKMADTMYRPPAIHKSISCPPINHTSTARCYALSRIDPVFAPLQMGDHDQFNMTCLSYAPTSLASAFTTMDSSDVETEECFTCALRAPQNRTPVVSFNQHGAYGVDCDPRANVHRVSPTTACFPCEKTGSKNTVLSLI